MASAAPLSAGLTVTAKSRTFAAHHQHPSNLCAPVNTSLSASLRYARAQLAASGVRTLGSLGAAPEAIGATHSTEDIDEDDDVQEEEDTDEDSEEGWRAELLDELNPLVYLQRHNPRKFRGRKGMLSEMLPSPAPEAGAVDWSERARQRALQSLEARNPVAADSLKKKMDPASRYRKQRKKKKKKSQTSTLGPESSGIGNMRLKVSMKKLEQASRLPDGNPARDNDEANSSDDGEVDLDGIDSIDDLPIGDNFGYGRWNADIEDLPAGSNKGPGLTETTKAFLLAFENAAEQASERQRNLKKPLVGSSKASLLASENASEQGSERERIFNKRLVGANSALEVLEIVGNAEEKSRSLQLPSLLTPLNVATALHRIGKHMETSGTPKSDRLAFARKRYMPELVARSMEVIVGSSAQGLSNIAWALSKIGGRTLYSVEMDLLAKAVLPKVTEFNPQNVANIVGAYASMQHASPSMFAGLCSHAVDILNEFRSQELAQMLWAYAELMQPAETLLDALDRICLLSEKGILDSLSDSDLINKQIEHLLSSTSSLEKLNPFGNASAEHLANLGWSYAVLDQIHRPSFKNLWQMLESIVNQNVISTSDVGRSLSTWHLSQIHQVNLCLRYGYSDRGSTLQPLLKDAAEHAWETQKRAIWSPSEYQKDVKWFLVSMGQNWVDEYSAADYSLDLALPKKRMAIEIDGPSHFIRNNGLPLGHTILKRKLLLQAGWVILPISYERWEELDGETEKMNFLKELVRTAG